MSKIIVGVLAGAVVVGGVAMWAIQQQTPAPSSSVNSPVTPQASAPADAMRQATTLKLTAAPVPGRWTG